MKKIAIRATSGSANLEDKRDNGEREIARKAANAYHTTICDRGTADDEGCETGISTPRF
jgi:hypothetical protein